MKRKEFSENRYNDFNFDINRVLYNSFRIDRIYNYLMDKIANSDISNMLDDMEKMF